MKCTWTRLPWYKSKFHWLCTNDSLMKYFSVICSFAKNSYNFVYLKRVCFKSQRLKKCPYFFDEWVEYSFCLFHYCVSPCTWLWHHTSTRALYLQLGVVMNIQKGILNYKIETFSPCISGILQHILSKKLEFDKNLTSGKQVYKYIERKKHLIISFYDYKIDIYIKNIFQSGKGICFYPNLVLTMTLILKKIIYQFL